MTEEWKCLSTSFLLNTQKCKYILLILIALGREERMKTLTDYFGNIFQKELIFL